ncbi:MAG: serine hydrolase, partial [Candidatus Tectomicrobia bacterium]|nr:serine hydrolase [Candidatus Tectomicrobia bacterium]
MSQIDTIIASIEGIVGLAARRPQGHEEILIRADETFPTASTLKVPVIVELFRQAGERKIDLKARVPFSHAMRVAGSGILQDLDDGIQPTVRDLAVFMIVVSDNAATDLLMEMVGKENLHNTMKSLGLAQTNIPMTTKEILYNIVGMDLQNPEDTYEKNKEKLTRGELILESDGLSDTKSDVSTPREMMRLLSMIMN